LCMWGVSTQRERKKIFSEDKQFWVELQRLSQGDRDDIQDILASMDLAGKSDEELKQVAKMNLGSMKALQRARSVKDWNIPELDDSGNPTGKVAPLNEESLRNISPELADAIDNAIDELNPERLSDKRKK
jgi:hypothetical protein